MKAIARSGSMPITSDEVSEGEDVSKKYLDGILGRLRRAGLLRTFRGRGGGYVLARPAEEITAGEVVRVLEGGFGVVPCVDAPRKCGKSGHCATREVWCSVSAAVNEVLHKVTIASLAAWEAAAEPSSLVYNI